MRNLKGLSSFALILGLLAGCGHPAAESRPTGLPTGEEKWTSTPSQPSTETPTVTPTLTETLSPTLSSTPTPVTPLAQQGPWLFLESDLGMWALNPDGTGLTQIVGFFSHPGYQGRVGWSIAPHGGRLAFFYMSEDPDSMVASPPELMLITLPDGSPQPLTPLHSGVPLPMVAPGPNPNGDVFQAVNYGTKMAWSPDGSMLAFVGAQDGPSTDLYVYATDTGTIQRLTDDPTQAIDPRWSPDGRYVLLTGASDMNYDVPGSDSPVVDTVWAMHPDGSDLRVVQTHAGNEDGLAYSYELGWVSNRAYVEDHVDLLCGHYGLTFVDFMTPRQTTFLPGAFDSMALDPATGTVLVTIAKIPESERALRDCGATPGPGWYLMSVSGARPPQSIPLEVPAGLGSDDRIWIWSPEAKAFFVTTSDGLSAVDLSGRVTAIDTPDDVDHLLLPTVSPNGEDWALPAYEHGLWITSLAGPARQIFGGDVEDVLWTPDGSAMLFTSDGVLYRAAAPDYQPVALADVPDSEIEWIMP